jgi:hypothetical protein
VYWQGILRRCSIDEDRPSVKNVDNREAVRQQVREFLTSRRARLTPDQAGLRDDRRSARAGAEAQ